MSLITHQLAFPNVPLRAADESKLIEYVHGSNGVIARSKRPGLEVGIPVGVNFQVTRGLETVAPYVSWGFPRVPAQLFIQMLEVSRFLGSGPGSPQEALFYLSWGPARYGDVEALGSADGWILEYPQQRATSESVEPIWTGAGTSTDHAIIEIHSHHAMEARFSSGDDADELNWFRVYAVLGTIFNAAQIRTRVCCFGHVMHWPSTAFFELPDGLQDTYGIE